MPLSSIGLRSGTATCQLPPRRRPVPAAAAPKAQRTCHLSLPSPPAPNPTSPIPPSRTNTAPPLSACVAATTRSLSTRPATRNLQKDHAIITSLACNVAYPPGPTPTPSYYVTHAIRHGTATASTPPPLPEPPPGDWFCPTCISQDRCLPLAREAASARRAHALHCPHCPAPIEDVAHILFHCPLYTTLRTQFTDLFPPPISTPKAWLAQPASARIANYIFLCYKLQSDTLTPPPCPMRPLLAPAGLEM